MGWVGLEVDGIVPCRVFHIGGGELHSYVIIFYDVVCTGTE